jgi:excisionase family DNA binding protein
MTKNENQERRVDVPLKDKLTWSVKEAAACSGLGEGLIREMAKQPDCPFVLYVGRRICIKRREFEDYLSRTNVIDTK